MAARKTDVSTRRRTGGPTRDLYVHNERVARAAARALMAANDKLGVESNEKTKRLAR
jgi:hypothetical protein